MCLLLKMLTVTPALESTSLSQVYKGGKVTQKQPENDRVFKNNKHQKTNVDYTARSSLLVEKKRSVVVAQEPATDGRSSCI